ncbi:MAG: ester cyclase [Polyangiaceae bacterium]|nr:ester cyclase [Polyangiaceae bacterium]
MANLERSRQGSRGWTDAGPRADTATHRERTSSGPGELTARALRAVALLNEGDSDALLALYHPEARLVTPSDVVLDREAIVELHAALRLAFPDLVWELAGCVEGEDAVVAELRFTGTHTGPLVNGVTAFAPTGSRVALRGCEIVRFRDGRVAEVRSYFDALALCAQLGMD